MVATENVPEPKRLQLVSSLPGERPVPAPSQRPQRRGDDTIEAVAAAVAYRMSPRFRRPFSDILLRWLVVLVPLAVGTLAGLLGVEFQQRADSISGDGLSPNATNHFSTVKQLTAAMGAIGVVGLMAMSLWSWLIVTNTNRVGHSLRTPWFAAIGWLLAPGLGVGAHLTLDRQLDSGWLVGITVFLAVLYLPFGTLGGAADDLAGSAQLARTWFLASVIGAFLLIVGMSGATSSLPVADPQNVLRIRAFACYLGGLMLLNSSALAFATARNLNALIGHRWAREENPDGSLDDPKRLKISRSGRALRRWLVPTLLLRLVVTLGVLGTGLAWVAVLFVFRGRYLRLSSTSVERDQVLADLRHGFVLIGVIAVAVHLVFILWAVVAACNAYRRSLLAPSPWAVLSAFLVGPTVMVIGALLVGPFGAAVLTVGFILAVAGSLIGQMVLGRTVSALGGRGRIFIAWMVVDVAMSLFAGFVSARSTNRIEIVAFGIALTGTAIVSAGLVWTAMTRLDRTCRAYGSGGTTATGFASAIPHSRALPAGGPLGGADQLPSMAFTSPQS